MYNDDYIRVMADDVRMATSAIRHNTDGLTILNRSIEELTAEIKLANLFDRYNQGLISKAEYELEEARIIREHMSTWDKITGFLAESLLYLWNKDWDQKEKVSSSSEMKNPNLAVTQKVKTYKIGK